MASVKRSDRTLEYQYSFLASADSIRILIIEPAPDTTTPIICDIEYISLEAPAKYSALSYSWGMNDDGDASLCRDMYIHGKHKAITRSLFEGLLRIRDSYERKRLWVDAVCINQDDVLERSAQVQMMSRIYATATAVYVWLGEGESEEVDQEAFTVLSCFSTEQDHELSHRTHDLEGRPIDICAVRKATYWLVAFGEPGDGGKERLMSVLEMILRSFGKIALRRVFKRRWVAQELAFARAPLLRWGSYALSFEEFENSLRGLDVFRSMLKTLSQKLWGKGEDGTNTTRVQAVISALILAIRPITELRKGGQTDITTIASLCNSMKCTDPRDYLYALLSLDKSGSISADYTLSVVSAYTKFATDLVHRGLAHVVLANCAAHFGNHDVLDALPTWVPDLREWFYHYPDVIPPTDNFDSIANCNHTLHCSLPTLGNLTNVRTSEDFEDDHVKTFCWKIELSNHSRHAASSLSCSPTIEKFNIKALKHERDVVPPICDDDVLTTFVTFAESSQIHDMGIPVLVLRWVGRTYDQKARVVLQGWLDTAVGKEGPGWEARACELLASARRRVFELV